MNKRCLTSVDNLGGTLGPPETEQDVVERNGADEIEEEERSKIMSGYFLRIQNDLVGKVVRYDTCRFTHMPTQVLQVLHMCECSSSCVLYMHECRSMHVQ